MSATEEPSKPQKRHGGRSPAYPFIPINKALEQAEALRKQDGDYAVPLSSAFQAWGYGAKSSGGRQTLAALKYYGFIDVDGEGDGRKVKISDLARRILLDKREDDSEKRSLIRRAALNPAAHQALLSEYPDGLASDGSVLHHLMFSLGFKEEGATELLAEFKETARFAGVYEPSAEVPKPAKGVDKFAVGDYVHWESGGQLQWATPWKVCEIQAHDDGSKYLRVEGAGDDAGSSGWIPMDQAIAADAPPQTPPSKGASSFAPPPRSQDRGRNELPEGMIEDKATLDEGEVILKWPENLSAESVGDFEYWINGIISRAKRRAGVSDKKAPHPQSEM